MEFTVNALQDLVICLSGLYDHIETTDGDEDKLQEYSSIEEFKEKHAVDLCSCLTALTCIYPNAVESYIKEIVILAEEAFKERPLDSAKQNFHMRKLSIALMPGAVPYSS